MAFRKALARQRPREQTGAIGRVCNPCRKAIYKRLKVAKTFAARHRLNTGDNNIVEYKCPVGHYFHIGHGRIFIEVENINAKPKRTKKQKTLDGETELDYAAMDYQGSANRVRRDRY